MTYLCVWAGHHTLTISIIINTIRISCTRYCEVGCDCCRTVWRYMRGRRTVSDGACEPINVITEWIFRQKIDSSNLYIIIDGDTQIRGAANPIWYRHVVLLLVITLWFFYYKVGYWSSKMKISYWVLNFVGCFRGH